MSHPDNEPGKSYDLDDRRRAAVLAACEGLPTEWLERGLVAELYKTIVMLALADHIGERSNGSISFPERWWKNHFRGMLDSLNSIATAGEPN